MSKWFHTSVITVKMFIKKQSALVASFGFLFPMKVTCLTLKHVKENPKQVEKNEENTMVT